MVEGLMLGMNMYAGLKHLFDLQDLIIWMNETLYDQTALAEAAKELHKRKGIDEFELEVLNAQNQWTERFKLQKKRIIDEQRRSSSKSKTNIQKKKC